MRSTVILATALCIAGLGASAQLLSYRPGREHRTINTDRYEISVQKNGRTDVLLVSRAPVFGNAYPMVWFEGEDEPTPLRIDGRWTVREEVRNSLGRGNGFVFRKDDCEWGIQTYPTLPFLTANVVYVNTSKKPVRVKALIPWAVGGPKKGEFSLGTGTRQAVILDTGTLTQVRTGLKTIDVGSCTCLWNLAAYNPVSQRSLIAGFLTNVQTYTQIHLERTAKAKGDSFDVFRAECLFDPPVEVPPKGRLESEWLYLAVDETNPLEGLERFGASVGLAWGAKPTRRALPHGWDSWSTEFHDDITEEAALAALDFMDQRLKRYGWTHFSIDDGWQRARGDWEPDAERFPHGMKWFADQVHERGMTVGLWTDPFTISPEAPLAKEHPEWLAKPNALGRTQMGDEARILDITAPGAYEYVRDVYAKIGQEWGYDALVETDFVYHLLLAESYARSEVTRVEALHMGMAAVREGFGTGKFIMAVAPLPVTGLVADGVRLGIDCAPIWRHTPDHWPWGCVDTLGNAARRYYYAPHLWAPDQDCAFFGHVATRERWHVTERPELTRDQSIAWLTGAALTGGAVKLGDNLAGLNDAEVDILRRILPVPRQPARPIDLFQREEPAIWSLPIRAPIGEWHIVGVFNWDETASQKIALAFPALGLKADAPYTVYDFWQDTFYGVARDQVNVDVAPGSVRLLGLRRFHNRPMFLATDRHFTQGANDFTALDWDAQNLRLTAAFDGVANTDYNLRVLVPKPYAVAATQASAGEPSTQQEGQVLKIAFHCAEKGPVNWSVAFTRD